MRNWDNWIKQSQNNAWFLEKFGDYFVNIAHYMI